MAQSSSKQPQGFRATVKKCFTRRSKTLESDYDPRFGSDSISNPIPGGYSSPDSQPPNTVLSATGYNRQVRSQDRSQHGSRTNPTSLVPAAFAERDHKSTNIPPWECTPHPSSLPVHSAFIPGPQQTMQTVLVSSPSNSPQPSPQLSTPRSTGSSGTRFSSASQQQTLIDHERNSGLPPHPKVAGTGGTATLNHTMNRHQQARPVVATQSEVAWEKKKGDVETPESAQSIEQWPGSY